MRSRSQISGSNGHSNARPANPPRDARARTPVRRMPPPAHLHRLELAGLDQLRERRSAALRPEAVVVAQVGFGGDAQRGGRAQHEPARSGLRIGRVRGEHRRGQHPFRQVVEPLEVVAAAGDQHAGPEEELADPLDRRALPPRRAGPAPGLPQRLLQRARADRAELLDRGEHVLDQAGVLLDEHAVVLPPPPAPRGHHQRPVGHRDEAGLVRPRLDQQPRPPRAVRPGGLVDQRRRVRAEPAEHRHVVRPDRDVDRIELQQLYPPEHAREVPAGHRSGRGRVGEPLGGQGGAPGGRGADGLDGRAHGPDAATTPRQFRAAAPRRSRSRRRAARSPRRAAAGP